METPSSPANPPSSDPSAQYYVAPRPPKPPAKPHDEEAVGLALSRPLRTIDVVIATPERVAVNIDERRSLGRLAVVFLLAGVLFTVPYSCVLGIESWWRLTALYLGSTLICLPSLYVFTSYTGTRSTLGQIGALALLIPASAAIFTLGFAPILGFLQATMEEDSTQIGWRSISNLLLGISLAAGIIQLWRCFLGSKQQPNPAILALVLIVWHAVFLYVFTRMFRVLEL